MRIGSVRGNGERPVTAELTTYLSFQEHTPPKKLLKNNPLDVTIGEIFEEKKTDRLRLTK